MYGLAIFGIVVLALIGLTILVGAVMMFPDFLRYMKMRSL
jgi:hypothetical protein